MSDTDYRLHPIAEEDARQFSPSAARNCVPISAVLLMVSLPGDTWLRLVIWLIIGLAIYFFYGMRHSRVGNEPEAA